MGYNDLSQCTLTADERLAEAERIVGMLDEMTVMKMQNHEAKFVDDMADADSCSVKQLFWLRDLKARYVD